MAQAPPCLIGSWVWSHDEDGGEVAVYRREGYPLPPARGREKLEFRDDGGVAALGVAPADGVAAAEGRWSAEGDAPVGVALPVGPAASELGDWIVEECADDLLKLRRRGAP